MQAQLCRYQIPSTHRLTRLLDTLFKRERKNEKMSLNQNHRSSLLHYLFLCLCATTFLCFVENSPRRGNCTCYRILRACASHRV